MCVAAMAIACLACAAAVASAARPRALHGVGYHRAVDSTVGGGVEHTGRSWARGRRASFSPPRFISYGVSEHARFDRVVFRLAGGLPQVKASYVRSVHADASGLLVPLKGRAFVSVVLMNLDWSSPGAVPPEPTLTPNLAVLTQMKPAGVFEGYFSFGLGLAYKDGYHIWTSRHPDRVIVDLFRR
jgi:hypothetical protein